MSIPEDLSARLPTPRADEPEALRQDIADELADHLLCAARSEHLKERTGGPISEQAALAAAIERFGEPSAVARRLWWDAMKEKIMAQRLLTIMATAATMAVLFACVLLWQSMQQMRALQAAEIAVQREALAAMIAELKSTKNADGAQWQTLKIRLIDESGKPVVGKVSCETRDKSAGDRITTGADGVASFLLPPGLYGIWIECNGYRASLPSILLPPKSIEQAVVCPSAEPKIMPVSFRIDLTDQSAIAEAPAQVFYVAAIQFRDRRIGETEWSRRAPETEYQGSKTDCWLLDSKGRILGQLPETPAPAPEAGAYPAPHGMRSVSTYFPKTIGPNPALRPVAGLSSGNYTLVLAAYIAADRKNSTDVKDAAVGADEAASTALEIPALKVYSPDFEKFWHAAIVSTEPTQQGSGVFPITDASFPKQPKSNKDALPPDLFQPSN
jgi:hypothetical protein